MAQLTCLSFLTLQEITGDAESVRGPCTLCGFQNLSELIQDDSTRSCTVAILHSNVSAYCTCPLGSFI